ncbi:hypothetical protein, partial [Mycobacteroides abscessus]|uniref:hypothetical protein n=1 Tax=Mycobacteroides abscessus TaxID=36809 RepID=UPI001A98147A
AAPPRRSMCGYGITADVAQEMVIPMSEVTDRIDKIDQMLFDAGVMVLSAKTGAQRKAADRKIMDARVELDGICCLNGPMQPANRS